MINGYEYIEINSSRNRTHLIRKQDNFLFKRN